MGIASIRAKVLVDLVDACSTSHASCVKAMRESHARTSCRFCKLELHPHVHHRKGCGLRTVGTLRPRCITKERIASDGLMSSGDSCLQGANRAKPREFHLSSALPSMPRALHERTPTAERHSKLLLSRSPVFPRRQDFECQLGNLIMSWLWLRAPAVKVWLFAWTILRGK